MRNVSVYDFDLESVRHPFETNDRRGVEVEKGKKVENSCEVSFFAFVREYLRGFCDDEWKLNEAWRKTITRATHEEHLLNCSRYSLVIKCIKWIKYANGAFRSSHWILWWKFFLASIRTFSILKNLFAASSNILLKTIPKYRGKTNFNISSWQYFNSSSFFFLHFRLPKLQNKLK